MFNHNLPPESVSSCTGDVSVVAVEDDDIDVMCTDVVTSLSVERGCVNVSCGVVTVGPPHDISRKLSS